MNTADPESFPPGVSASGGMMRSARASIVLPSSLVKKSQGPRATAAGGAPALGVHGRWSRRTVALEREAPRTKYAAAVNSSRRQIASWLLFFFMGLLANLQGNGYRQRPNIRMRRWVGYTLGGLFE